MGRKTKYVKGEELFTIDMLTMVIENHEYVYLNDRPLHPAWLYNMSLQRLMMFLRGGNLHCTVERSKARVCDHAKTCTYQGCLHRFAHICRPGAVKCYEIQQTIECLPWDEANA